MNRILDCMDGIDPVLLEEHLDAGTKKPRNVYRIAALAACLAVLLVLAAAFGLILLRPDTLLLKTQADTSSDGEDGFIEAMIREEIDRNMPESFKEDYKKWYVLDHGSNRYTPFSEISITLSDEMIGGIPLYDGHFYRDFETNGFDETPLMNFRVKVVMIKRYYNKLCAEFEKTCDYETALKLTALEEILCQLEATEINYLPVYR